MQHADHPGSSSGNNASTAASSRHILEPHMLNPGGAACAEPRKHTAEEVRQAAGRGRWVVVDRCMRQCLARRGSYLDD